MIDKRDQEIKSLEKLLGAKPTSPLFAKLASLYLERGKAQEALEMCDQGLAHHPFYMTAHLVKGKALLMLEMTSEARRELELVHKHQPLVESVRNLLDELGPSPDDLSAIESRLAQSEPTPVPEPPRIIVSDSAPKVVRPPKVIVKAPASRPQPQKTEPEASPPKPQPQPPEPIEEPPKPEPPNVEPVVEPEAQTILPEEPSKPEEMGAEKELEEQAIQELESEGAFGDLDIEEPPASAAGEEDVAEPLIESFTEVPAEVPEPVSNQVADSDDPFGIGISDAPPIPLVAEETIEAVAESFEEFSARMRERLGGTENSLTLHEYFASSEGSEEPQEISSVESPESAETAPQPVAEESEAVPTEPPVMEAKNQIEDIAEKLKTAKKITPVINLAERSSSATDEPRGSTGFVTPTLAEIYAKQGWYDDAIRAYRQLSISKPAEKEKFEKRIAEIEAEKKRTGQ